MNYSYIIINKGEKVKIKISNFFEMEKIKRKLVYVFMLSFVLNWVWENLHSDLYLNYRGGDITQPILLQASFLDALFIAVLGIVVVKIEYLRKRIWYSLIFGVIAAAVVEIYALHTGWWVYNELMPIVPVINTGLTPTIQLGLLAYIVYKTVWLDR